MNARDNGLTAGSYVFVASVAPPLAPDLLAELREEGIAAYTVPSGPRVHGVTLAMPDIRLPMERLYVDRVTASYAHVLVRRRRAAYEESQPEEPAGQPEAAVESSDEDEAWRRILAGYDRPVEDGERPWPAAEDVPTAGDGEAPGTAVPATVEPAAAPDPGRTLTGAGYDTAGVEEEEEHFVPPPPPPLPKEDMPTKAAFAAIAAGLASLCLMLVFDWARQWWIVLLTVAVLAAGVVTHVLRIGDPRSPGSDDGAEV